MSAHFARNRRWIILCVVGAALLGAAIFLKRRYRPAAIRSNVQVLSQPHIPSLHINSVVQHGHIAEINGTTDPGVLVMINGEQAAVVFEGNQFHHFVGPLATGTTIVSITCQNEEGGSVTQKIAVTVE